MRYNYKEKYAEYGEIIKQSGLTPPDYETFRKEMMYVRKQNKQFGNKIKKAIIN